MTPPTGVIGGGPIWMIGCGNMGGAMLRRWLGDGMSAERVTVVTRGVASLPAGVRHLHVLPPDAEPELVILAVKPPQLGQVAPMLTGVNPPMLLSILAGVDVTTLATLIQAGAVVRAMPNLPVAIGKGVTALYASTDDPAIRGCAQALAESLGLVEWIMDETQFDLVTALAGSGPGFVFRFIDALARAATALGLDRGQAARLALATVEGAAAMAAASAESPVALADQVASKGGSTRKGLDVLDRDEALFGLLSETLAAAARRNREMGAETRR